MLLTREIITQLANSQGLNTYYREDNKRDGSGVSYTYLRIYKQLDKRRISVDLGRLEPLQAMPPEALGALIRERWEAKLKSPRRELPEESLRRGDNQPTT